MNNDILCQIGNTPIKRLKNYESKLVYMQSLNIAIHMDQLRIGPHYKSSKMQEPTGNYLAKQH